MDHSSEIAELLSRHGFRRFMMSRTKVGHLELAGHIDDQPIHFVVDTGAGKTFVELGYCRSEGQGRTRSHGSCPRLGNG